jgi:hypothetical protein
VEFHLDAAFWNQGPNYLSACEAALPRLFAGFAAAFLAAGGVWVRTLHRATPAATVHHIHWLMAVLVFFKVAVLLSARSPTRRRAHAAPIQH